MRKPLLFVLLPTLLLFACTAPSASQEMVNQGQLPEVIVYKSPT